MNIGKAFPSNYLKASDFEQDTVYTIKGVAMESIGQGRDAEDKPILHFEETDLGLVLNRTNANTISGLYGVETEGWKGKKVTLFATEVQFGSEMVMAVRVRTRPPKTHTAPAPDAPPSSDLATAKANAWRKFQVANQAMSREDSTKALLAAAKAYLPEAAVAAWQPQDWNNFAASNFVKAEPKEHPFDENGAVAEADIPF